MNITLALMPLWGKAGMGARPALADMAWQAPTPTLPQRGRERRLRQFHRSPVLHSLMDN